MNREQWNAYLAIAPKPNLRHNWQNETALRLRGAFETDTDVVDGALRWKSNGSVIPPGVFKDAELITPDVQADAYKVHLDAFLAAYRANPPVLSDEQRAEMHNELGPDVVDVVTGQKI